MPMIGPNSSGDSAFSAALAAAASCAAAIAAAGSTVSSASASTSATSASASANPSSSACGLFSSPCLSSCFSLPSLSFSSASFFSSSPPSPASAPSSFLPSSPPSFAASLDFASSPSAAEGASSPASALAAAGSSSAALFSSFSTFSCTVSSAFSSSLSSIFSVAFSVVFSSPLSSVVSFALSSVLSLDLSSALSSALPAFLALASSFFLSASSCRAFLAAAAFASFSARSAAAFSRASCASLSLRSFSAFSCSIFQELSMGTVNFQRPAPYKSMRCAPRGKSFTRASSSFSVATAPKSSLPNMLSGEVCWSAKLTKALFSPAMVTEKGSPQVIMFKVAFKSSTKRSFHRFTPRPRGNSKTQATVLSGARPCSMISSRSCSILFFSFFGSFFFFFQDFSIACIEGSSPRTFVLPDMNEGVKDITSKALSFHASVQNKSSIFGRPSSASCTDSNHLSPACNSATRSSTCLRTGEPAGMNFRIRCVVSSTEFAKCTKRFGTQANFWAMPCEHRKKVLRVFSRR
mmetsp:Transcript_12194/g.30713  ORF Transcript_12194/g.30713 Transcript_12194/m.30713 type:complete len:521 (-) Transcript_12194:6-1568(-)